MSSWLRSLRTRDEPRFFFSGSDATEIVEHLARAVPGWSERTLADADKVTNRVLRLLGEDDFDFRAHADSKGDPAMSLPWHEDVLNDYRWDPRTFYREVPFPYDRAEVKVPWELSRFQHLPTLGMAYLVSGSDKYAGEAIAQIEDWIRKNAPGYGINWACTMDVAIRGVNWLWAYHFLAGAPQLTDDFLTRFLASLAAHGRYISRNIEIYDRGLTTNHTVADYTGLVYLGLALPELREATRWVEMGMQGLVECMEAQVAPDGVDFENSVAYHRMVLEMFLGAYVLAQRNGRPFPDTYRAALERMLEFVYHYTRPDGLAPLVGDSDDGRLQVLSQYFDWQPQDHRYLLGVGAAVFGRDDFAAVAADAPGALEEAAWLLGPQALRDLTGRMPAPVRESRAFPESGRYVMRHGDHYAFISTDEVGTGGLGNHKHNDILGFELCVGGETIVVDAGSYLYLSDSAWRDHFRSTAAHSTVVVDGAEQNEMVGPFAMRRDARVTVATWQSNAAFDVLDASHTGYERLPQPVAHRRRICFQKDPCAWLVVDSLAGTGEHTMESFLHLSPTGEVADGGPVAAADRRGLEGTINVLGATLELAGMLQAFPEGAVTFSQNDVGALIVPVNWSSVDVRRGWVSPRWGQRVRAPVVVLSGRVETDTLVGYLILAT